MKKNLNILILSFFAVLNATAYAGIQQPNTDEYDVLRTKWKNILTGAGANSSDKHITAKKLAITTEAQLQWSKLNKTEGRTHLWDDLTSTKISAEITYAYRRIYSMALAYNTEGSPLKGNQMLRHDIITALMWMNENRYVKMYNDWWDFQIGAPLELNNCITLMYDDLSELQRIALNERLAKLTGNPTTDGGANRAWRAFVYAINGILKKDSSKIEIAKNSLSAIFEYVEKGEGFFKDGSFVQHTDHPYNLCYGVEAIGKVSDLMVLLNDSKWEATDPNSQYLYAWISDSFEPFIYKGVAMDMVRGREMARYYKQDYVSGFLMIGNIAMIAQFAPQPYASAFESLVKYWLVSNKQRDYFAYAVENASLNTLLQVKNIFKNPAVKPKAELIQYR